jgi:signal transduction histidine kinase
LIYVHGKPVFRPFAVGRRTRDARNRIFNAFFTTKPQGSGLGLAIVRKVVDAHDGRIDIQTGAHGTRFRVTLPISGANDWFVPKPGLPRSLTDD